MRTFLIFIVSCLFFSSVWADSYYRWTDEKGVTHYTTTAPSNQASDRVNVATGTSGSIEEAQAAAAALTHSDNSGKPNDADLFLERCKQYRENLDLLNSDKSLTTKDADGNEVDMDSAARAKMKSEVETILRSCPPA